MLKRAIPVFLALAVACPITAYAAESSETGEPGGVNIKDETISVLTAGGTYSETMQSGASYYPLEIRTVLEDGEKLIVKTYEVPSGVNPQQLVEDNIEKNGISYELRDILKRTVEENEEKKLASKIVEVDSKTKDEAEILKQLSPIIDYNEGGYTGQLQLDPGSIYTEADGYASYRYPVREVRQMAGMDRNDTYYIPKAANVNGMQMTLNNIQWDTMGCGAANNGRLVPNNFKAVAEYVGYATGSKATGYTATATYIGEVSRPAGGAAIFSLVYAPVGAAEHGSDALQEIGGLLKTPDGKTSEEVGMGPFFVVASVLILGAAATFVILWLRKREPRPAAVKAKTRIYMPRKGTGEDDEDE